MKIQLVSIPTHAGALLSGTELAPTALRQAQLHQTLTEKGWTVLDHGDLALPDDLPRHNLPPVRNWPAPRMVWEAIAETAPNWFTPGDFTLLLGGDCSIVVGTIDALCRMHGDNVYLLVVDAHVDILEPLPNRCMGAAGMGLWFSTTDNPFWEKPATFSPKQVTVFACQSIPEQATDFSLIPLESLREQGLIESAQRVLAELPQDAIVLVHFDVDALCQEDMPAAYAPSEQGLRLAECAELLSLLIADPRVIGMEVTEFSAVNDADGTSAQRLVALLSDVLANKKTVRL